MKQYGDPNGIRTRVTAVKGRCPRPLDDRVRKSGGNIRSWPGQRKLFASEGRGSFLESVAIEGAAQLAGTAEIAGVKTEEGREHSLLQVEIEMRSEQRQ
jgi:hypothetical protein